MVIYDTSLAEVLSNISPDEEKKKTELKNLTFAGLPIFKDLPLNVKVPQEAIDVGYSPERWFFQTNKGYQPKTIFPADMSQAAFSDTKVLEELQKGEPTEYNTKYCGNLEVSLTGWMKWLKANEANPEAKASAQERIRKVEVYYLKGSDNTFIYLNESFPAPRDLSKAELLGIFPMLLKPKQYTKEDGSKDKSQPTGIIEIDGKLWSTTPPMVGFFNPDGNPDQYPTPVFQPNLEEVTEPIQVFISRMIHVSPETTQAVSHLLKESKLT